MKLVWSPETATKKFRLLDCPWHKADLESCRLKSSIWDMCELYKESGVAELVSAMAAGWNAKLIVETWSQGGVIATSIGLAIASRHTGGRHVCVVPDERSSSNYMESMGAAGMAPEVIIGEAEELAGIDFLVVDSRRRDFARVLRLAKLSHRGAVLVCKNASSRSCSSFRWRSIVEDGPHRVVRSVFLPVGKGLDVAHVSGSDNGGSSGAEKGGSRWIKHVDRISGEEHVIRKS